MEDVKTIANGMLDIKAAKEAIEKLPLDKQMFIAGAIAALSASPDKCAS